jgi:hypothetical protein
MLVYQKLFPQRMTCQKMTQHVPVHSIRDLPNAPLCPFVGHLTPFFVRNLHLQTPNIGEYIQIGAVRRLLPPPKTCHVSFSGRSLVVSRSLAIRSCLAPETVDVGLISSDFDPFGKLGCLVSTKASTGSRWYHLTQIYEVFNYTLYIIKLHYYGIPGIPYHYDDICCERTLGQRWEFWNVQVYHQTWGDLQDTLCFVVQHSEHD